MGQLRREQGLRLEGALRITDQHPTDRHRVVAALVPDAGLTIDLHCARPTAVPLLHLQLGPGRERVSQALLWAGAARPFHARASLLPGLPGRSRVPQLRVQPQLRNQAHPRQAAHQLEQIQHRKATVSDKHQRALGQPARHQLDDLPGAVKQRLMLALVGSVVARGGTQHRQERQAPARARPFDADQQHRAEGSASRSL